MNLAKEIKFALLQATQRGECEAEAIAKCLDDHGLAITFKALTFENGMKQALCGEILEPIELHNEDGESYTMNLPIRWTTIKEIHKKVISLSPKIESKTNTHVNEGN